MCQPGFSVAALDFSLGGAGREVKGNRYFMDDDDMQSARRDSTAASTEDGPLRRLCPDAVSPRPEPNHTRALRRSNEYVSDIKQNLESETGSELVWGHRVLNVCFQTPNLTKCINAVFWFPNVPRTQRSSQIPPSVVAPSQWSQLRTDNRGNKTQTF